MNGDDREKGRAWGLGVARVCLGVAVGIAVGELAWAYGDAGFTDVVRRTAREAAWWNPLGEAGGDAWNQFREMPGYRAVWDDRRAVGLFSLWFLHLVMLLTGCFPVLVIARERKFRRDWMLCAAALGLSGFAAWGYRSVANAGIVAQVSGDSQRWQDFAEQISREWPAPGGVMLTKEGEIAVSLKDPERGYCFSRPPIPGPAVGVGMFVNREAVSGEVQILFGSIEDEVWLVLKKDGGEFRRSEVDARGEEQVKKARRVTAVGRGLFVVEYEVEGIF